MLACFITCTPHYYDCILIMLIKWHHITCLSIAWVLLLAQLNLNKNELFNCIASLVETKLKTTSQSQKNRSSIAPVWTQIVMRKYQG